MPCFALAAFFVACMGYAPDTSKTVVVPRSCAAKLSIANQDKAKACAAERGVTWTWARKKSRRR